jgi:hypothetical protein
MFNTIKRRASRIRFRVEFCYIGLLVSSLTLALSGCQAAQQFPGETVTVTQPPVTITATVTATATVTLTPQPAPQPLSSTPSQGNKIVISYSSQVNTTLNDNTGHSLDPKPGYIFLATNVNVENFGYDYFETFYGYFTMIVDGVEYRCVYPSSVDGYLLDVRVLDSGRIDGKLLYEVPASVLTSGFNLAYSKSASTGRPFNIQWINLSQ